MENKNSSKEKLIEKIIAGDMQILFNKEDTIRQGNFSNFEISYKIFRDELENEISMENITHRMLLNAIHCAYVQAIDQDISKVKTILIHFHDVYDLHELKLTLNDYPESKWIITIRHPLGMMNSDVQFYNQFRNKKGRTLPLFLQKNNAKNSNQQVMKTVS